MQPRLAPSPASARCLAPAPRHATTPSWGSCCGGASGEALAGGAATQCGHRVAARKLGRGAACAAYCLACIPSDAHATHACAHAMQAQRGAAAAAPGGVQPPGAGALRAAAPAAAARSNGCQQQRQRQRQQQQQQRRPALRLLSGGVWGGPRRGPPAHGVMLGSCHTRSASSQQRHIHRASSARGDRPVHHHATHVCATHAG